MTDRIKRSILDREMGWVAGIVEGEGWITTGVYDGRRRITVGVNMTDEDVVLRLRAVTGLGRVYGPYQSPSMGSNKPKWVWRVVKHKEAAALLMTLYPLLGQRRQEKARETLAFWRAS